MQILTDILQITLTGVVIYAGLVGAVLAVATVQEIVVRIRRRK